LGSSGLLLTHAAGSSAAAVAVQAERPAYPVAQALWYLLMRS